MIDDNLILDHVLSDATVVGLEEEEDNTIDHTFEKIMLEDNRITKKRNKLPVVIFTMALVTLIIVIVVILIVKKG